MSRGANLGSRDSSTKQQRNDCAIADCARHVVGKRLGVSLQEQIGFVAEKERNRFILGPRFMTQEFRGRIAAPKFEHDEMPAEPVNQLDVAQSCSRARGTTVVDVCKKRFQMLRAEVDQGRLMGDEVAQKTFEHSRVLRDGARGKGPAIRAGRFGCLPFTVGRSRMVDPQRRLVHRHFIY
ncbi:MAG TPA: hypothetical protein VGH41_23035 [Paraburkholderia sp.]